MAVNQDKAMTFKDTVSLIRRTHLAQANPSAVSPHYDGTSGEYDNLAEWWSLIRDGKVFGVKIPEYTYSNDPDGIKTRDNVGLVIEPSSQTVAGRDDYAKLSAFKVLNVNATIDASGVPHVTAIEGDGMYAADGSNGDVWVMACNGYYSITRDGSYKTILYSDSPQQGFKTMPGGQYADGTRRPYLLFAKYAVWLDADNIPHSWSGKPRSMQFGSESNNVAYAKKKGAGYSGRTIADNFYLQMMIMLKYATQNSQKLGGCSDYAASYPLTMAETGVNRVVLAKAHADYIVPGSCVNVGTSTDRGLTDNYSTAENRRVVKIEAVDTANTALYLDGAALDTSTSLYVTTMPWIAGSCDGILGIDGYPVSGKPVLRQPYSIQGIEFMIGCYEVLADIIFNQIKASDDSGRIEVYKCFDCRNYSTSSVANYTKCELELPPRTAADNAQWLYGKDWEESALAPGLLVTTSVGATSTTGTCDGIYSNPITSAGYRECLCFADLWHGALAGVLCAPSNYALGYYGWNCAGRLSGLGVSKPSA